MVSYLLRKHNTDVCSVRSQAHGCTMTSTGGTRDNALALIKLTKHAVILTKWTGQWNDKNTRKQQRWGLDVWSVGFSHDWKCKKALKHSARLRKTTVVTNPGLHIFSLEEKRRAEIYLKGNKREANFILVRIFQPQSIWPVTINNGGHGELWGAVRTLLIVRFCQHLLGNLFLHLKCM